MKAFHSIYLLALVLLLALSPRSLAKRPDLDNIFYGTLYHQGGTELFAEVTGQIVVQAELSGVVIGEAVLDGGTSQFVLKVPMDDGGDPRVPGTARAGERVRVFLKNTSLGVRFEANQSDPLGLSIPTGGSGIITQQTLTVDEDLGGMAPQSVQFAAWAGDHGITGEVGEIAGADDDGDGWSNYDEFKAGTDPNSGTSVFRIIGINQLIGNNFVEFGPVLDDRYYTIWCSETLGSGDWSNLGQVSPGADAASFFFAHPTPIAPNVFYRLEVNFAP